MAEAHRGGDRADPRAVLRPLRFGLVRRLAGRVIHVLNYGQRRRRYDAYALEAVQGAPVVCMPGVLNPKLMRSGEFFASHIETVNIEADWIVLDMGTGTGVGAVFAARRARRVIGVDINAEAVRCAMTNAWLNGVEQRVDMRHGDLFEPLVGERFDLVLFNPPFVRGVPTSELDRAWRSTDVARRFAAGLQQHLRPDGYALLLLSTYGDAQWYLDALHEQECRVSVAATRDYFNERLVIFKVQPALERAAAGVS
jgi:release factor glutamine methyltransferase